MATSPVKIVPYPTNPHERRRTVEYTSRLFDPERERPDDWLNAQARDGWRLFGSVPGPHGSLLFVMERRCAALAVA